MVEVQAFMAAQRRLSTEQRALMGAGTSVAEAIRALAMAGAGIRALAVVAGNITDDIGANVHTRAGQEISRRQFTLSPFTFIERKLYIRDHTPFLRGLAS
jgi:hypothetical protein